MTRQISSKDKLDATNGVINVDNDHKNTAEVSTDLPPIFLDALAPMT